MWFFQTFIERLAQSVKKTWREQVSLSNKDILPKGYFLDCISKLRVNRNNSAEFDFGFSSTECTCKYIQDILCKDLLKEISNMRKKYPAKS